MDSEYTCVLKHPKKRILKKKRWVLHWRDIRVESFTMKNGKKVPSGLDFTYRCIIKPPTPETTLRSIKPRRRKK